jgi:hypothetical protein
MRTLGQLLICVLLAVPSAHAAFGPWDVELDSATAIAQTLERHVAAQSNQLALFLRWPALQLRTVLELPVIRELTRSLRLREVQQLLTETKPAPARPSCGAAE